MGTDRFDLSEFFDDDERPESAARQDGKHSRAAERENREHLIAERTIQTGSRSKAAKELGYSPSTTYQDSFNQTLKDKQNRYKKRLHVSTDNVLNEYARIGFFDIKELFDDNGHMIPIQNLSDDVSSVISGIDVQTTNDDNSTTTITKFKLADKKGSLDSLAKHLNLFEKHNESKTEVHALSDNERARRIVFTLMQGAKGIQKGPEKD